MWNDVNARVFSQALPAKLDALGVAGFAGVDGGEGWATRRPQGRERDLLRVSQGRASARDVTARICWPQNVLTSLPNETRRQKHRLKNVLSQHVNLSNADLDAIIIMYMYNKINVLYGLFRTYNAYTCICTHHFVQVFLRVRGMRRGRGEPTRGRGLEGLPVPGALTLLRTTLRGMRLQSRWVIASVLQKLLK